jgi:hypothetical protein
MGLVGGSAAAAAEKDRREWAQIGELFATSVRRRGRRPSFLVMNVLLAPAAATARRHGAPVASLWRLARPTLRRSVWLAGFAS